MFRATPASLPHEKPEKPDGFPLYAHGSGMWAKKIKGVTRYFGPWSDPDGALKKYHKEVDDWQAGRVPQKADGALTVAELTKAFLASKQRLVDSDELSPRTVNDYREVCEAVEKKFGKSAHVASLGPDDFDDLRAGFAKKWGPVRLLKSVGCTKTLFKFASRYKITVEFGDGFKKPSRKVLRTHRKKRLEERGKRAFEAADIRRMLDEAGPQLKAMIYLGINAGLGNNDCVLLCKSNLNLKSGWLDFPRPKTEVDRRCPLWPETVEALKAALEKRPTPKDDAHTPRVFITKSGHSWEPKSISDNPVSKEMAKLLAELDLKRDGVNFYALRHTFQTVGEKSRDKDAVRAIMGHAESSDDMGAVYNEDPIDDDRLKAVTDYVRAWLFAEAKPKPR